MTYNFLFEMIYQLSIRKLYRLIIDQSQKSFLYQLSLKDDYMKIDCPFERIYDYRFEMIFRKLTIIWHANGVRGFLPIEFGQEFNRQEPATKIFVRKIVFVSEEL